MEQITHTVQDLSYLSWSKVRNSSGTAGSFLKAQEETSAGRVYYKLSDYDPLQGVIGHESVNEIIADRLLNLLGIPHLPYRLIHAKIMVDERLFVTWLCASSDFRQRGEKKIALDEYYSINRLAGESALDFCVRNGWSEYIYQMLIFDYLILNRDRHGANIEVLINPYQHSVRLAPLFDHGVSLFCRCHDESALEKEDVMADKPVQCFVGSRSAWNNLRLIPKNRHPMISSLKESDRNVLFTGLDDVIGKKWMDRIWEMIWRRWLAYADFRDQR